MHTYTNKTGLSLLLIIRTFCSEDATYILGRHFKHYRHCTNPPLHSVCETALRALAEWEKFSKGAIANAIMDFATPCGLARNSISLVIPIHRKHF